MLGPFFYTWLDPTPSVTQLPRSLDLNYNGQELTCALAPQAPLTWETAIQAGCPGALASFNALVSANRVADMFSDLGFYAQPDMRLPVAEASPEEPITDSLQAVLGQSGLKVSPCKWLSRRPT